MKRSRFTEEQMIAILKESETGAKSNPLADIETVLLGAQTKQMFNDERHQVPALPIEGALFGALFSDAYDRRSGDLMLSRELRHAGAFRKAGADGRRCIW